MVAAFDVADVNSNPARFDQKKADAINAEHIRLLDPEDFSARLRTYLAETRDWPIDYPAKDFAFLAEMVQTRIKTLGEAWDLVKFLVVSDDEFQLDEKSARRNLKEDAVAALDATIAAVEGLPEEEFTTPAIEAALQKALIEDLELKPRKAFGPIRVAVTGAQVSPPLFESMELLGREKSLARLKTAREVTPWQSEPAQ